MMPTTHSTPTHGLSPIRSVVSSWAMWIHHSCGSLMKIQMKAAAPSTKFLLIRSGFQRRRTPS